MGGFDFIVSEANDFIRGLQSEDFTAAPLGVPETSHASFGEWGKWRDFIKKREVLYGKADFIAKLQIALKECYETEYWIEIAQKANIVSEESVKTLLHDCGAFRRMLIASINTSKEVSRG